MAIIDKSKRTLMDYSPEIKILDCTLRDGGLVNNFEFSEEFVKELYLANIKAGVDYMEFGYKADKELFDPKEFGKWKFCDEADIRAVVGENNSPLKISVMADVGRCNYMKDFVPKSESVIDLVRVATYIHQIPAAIKMIEHFKELGYEVSVNVMAVSKVDTESLDAGLALLAKSNVDIIYLVDSFGSFYPEQVMALSNKYVDIANASGKIVGIHAHNNQQLAFANTIEGCREGICLLDATVSGMGRGAGNCYLESLLTFLRNPKYEVRPIIKFIETYIAEERAKGSVWGYDIPYLLTGIMNSHPSTAIKFIKENRKDYLHLMEELMDNE